LDYIVNLNKLACMFNVANDKIGFNLRIGLDLSTYSCLEDPYFSFITTRWWTKFALHYRSNQYCGYTMLNASMMCDAWNREESSTTNNGTTSTHIANNIEIKTKHQNNINCKIKRMMILTCFHILVFATTIVRSSLAAIILIPSIIVV
jgi:hypothetical protein